MSGPAVTKRKRRKVPPPPLVAFEWVEALEEADRATRGDGDRAWLHRPGCPKEHDGTCDCQVVVVGPSVREWKS